MIYLKFGLSILVILAFFPLKAVTEAKPSYVLCKNRKLARTVRVIEQKDSCQTIYTKFGADKVVGFGEYPDYCYRVLSNIKNNLEEAGWGCRDISAATVTRNNVANE